MTSKELKKVVDIDKWFYVPSWRKRRATIRTRGYRSHSIAFIRSGMRSDRAEPLIAALRCSADLIEVGVSEEGVILVVTHDGETTSFSDWPQAWAYLRQLPGLDTLVFVPLLGLADAAPIHGPLSDQLRHLHTVRQNGFYRLIEIVSAVATSNWTQPLRLVQLLTDAFDILPGDRIDPFAAQLAPCTKVVAQELPFFSCATVEVRADELQPGSATVHALVGELLHSSGLPVVGIRSGTLWEESFVPQPIGLAPVCPIRPGGHGAYLITGGRGRIGYTMARHLAKHYSANLVLTGISPVPPRSEWDDALSAPETEPTLRAELQKVRALEAHGSSVRLMCCDASDAEATASVIDAMDNDYGGCAGVVHAAGIFEAQRAFRGILDTSEIDCQRRFLPKVEGSLALYHSLAGRRLDFAYMQSSLSSVLGGFGFLAYSSGNAFMDAFAESVRTPEQPWMSVNWDGWVFRDSDAEAAGRSVISSKFASPDFGVVAEIAIRPDEGAACLERLLQWGQAGQVLVSTAPLENRIAQWVHRITLSPTTDPNAPQEHSPADKPGGDAVNTICELFGSLLGVDEVNQDSDFFELGGDSLGGIQLTSELSAIFGMNFDVISLLEEPTPRRIAEQLNASRLTRTLLPNYPVAAEARVDVDLQ